MPTTDEEFAAAKAEFEARRRMKLLTRLEEAEDAYHKLLMGTQARVFVDQNGERVEYKTTDSGRLRQYIERLRFECDPSTQRGPLEMTVQTSDEFLFFLERDIR